MLRFLQYSLEQVDPHVETLRAVWPAKAKWVLRDGQAVRRHVPTRCGDAAMCAPQRIGTETSAGRSEPTLSR